MTEPATPGSGAAPQQVPARRLPLVNSATVRGGVAAALGLFVLLVPQLSVRLVEVTVFAALLFSGGSDMWKALRGGGRRLLRRSFLLLRGVVSFLFALLVVAVPREAVDLLVELIGVYLVLRGLLMIVSLLLRREGSDVGVRISAAAASLGFGALAVVAPGTTTNGLVVGAALAGVVVGGIVLYYGLSGAADGVGLEGADASVTEILWDWVRNADVGSERRESLADGLYFEEPNRAAKLTAWWVMLLLSVAIATFAVLQDSTAVVIGAMLIAPLMVPILGLAGALVNGWTRLAGQSVLLLLSGVLAAVVLSYALSSWAPVALALDTNTQITSRVEPTLVDLLIALAAGAAGAFATVNPRVASSIGGVAIAVALVPPLSVVGITLGAQRYVEAGGAFLLFLTNFVAIVLAAAVVFVLAGFAQFDLLRVRSRRVRATLVPFVALAAIVLLPLAFNSQGLIATATSQRQAHDAVLDWLGPESALDIEDVTVSGDEVDVALSGPSPDLPPLEPLQDSLAEELRQGIRVRVAVAPVRVSELPTPAPSPPS